MKATRGIILWRLDDWQLPTCSLSSLLFSSARQVGIALVSRRGACIVPLHGLMGSVSHPTTFNFAETDRRTRLPHARPPHPPAPGLTQASAASRVREDFPSNHQPGYPRILEPLGLTMSMAADLFMGRVMAGSWNLRWTDGRARTKTRRPTCESCHRADGRQDRPPRGARSAGSRGGFWGLRSRCHGRPSAQAGRPSQGP